MNLEHSSDAKFLDTEIAVVGGGGAGLAAGLAAAENGAKVIVLEKRGAFGGNSALAGGIFAADSPVQKRMMIEAPREEMFKKAMDYSHWKTDPDIVRAFVYRSGDTVRWLEEKGLKFDWIPPLFPNQVPRVLHWPEGQGAALIKLLVKNCRELGVGLFEHSGAKKIRTNEKGEVSGIIAVKKKKEIRLNTKCVIVATGGYSGNKELMKKYSSYAENRELTAIPHTGDGLIMCIEIGAATEGLGLLLLSGPRVPGSFLLSAVAAEPLPVMVNKMGKRFSDENIPCHFERGNTVDRQQDGICYALFDAKIKEMIIKEGLKRPGWGMDRQVVYFQPEIDPERLEKELRSEADKGGARISDSWDEIAKWMEAPNEVLRTTINTYNASCHRGLDEMFVKDPKYLMPLETPPYHALKCHSGFLGTIGGIKINHHMEVLNAQGIPIPGLYAAGVDTGGWQGDTYTGRDLAGSAFGFALNSGRIAGENAAGYALKRR
jgi:fumarate reductase flavoprotein subunit